MADTRLNKLTANQVKSAQPQDKLTTLADGGGLVLQITSQGSKRWRFRYRYEGVPKMLSLGIYPDTTLAMARESRSKARQDLACGIDPSQKRQSQRQSQASSFKAVAEEWLESRNSVEQSTTDVNRARLENHVYPLVGSKPIASVTPQQVLKVLKRLEKKGTPELARRIRVLVGQVFRYAIATTRAEINPAEALRDAIEAPKTKGFSFTTDPEQLGGILRAIWSYQYSDAVKAALQLATLTMMRPGELRTLEWADVDLDESLITIPAERTKTKRKHLVPLAPIAVNILRELHPFTGEGRLVFPGTRDPSRPLSDMTLTAALRRMDIGSDQQHVHGFRHTASTLLHELGFVSDWVERQLAHVDGSVKGIYNAAEYLPQRRAMLEFWADYLNAMRLGEKLPKANLGAVFSQELEACKRFQPSQEKLAEILGL